MPEFCHLKSPPRCAFSASLHLSFSVQLELWLTAEIQKRNIETFWRRGNLILQVKWVFRISVLLNVALLLGAAWVWVRPQSPPPPHTAIRDQAAPPVAPTPEFSAQPQPKVDSVTITNAFLWRFLEATNCEEFAARLRSVGCPERTVRDIIAADAGRRFALLEEVESFRERTPFWLAGREMAAVEQRARTNQTAAQQALFAEVARALGVEWSPQEAELHRLEGQALARMVIGPIPEAATEATLHWFFLFIRDVELTRRDRNRVVLEREVVAWEKHVAARQAQLTQILGPMAFEELQARSALLEDLFANSLIRCTELELTPAQLRQLSIAKLRSLGWLNEIFAFQRNRAARSDEEVLAAFHTAAREILPRDTFEELVRVQNDAYRDILRVTQDYRLPRQTARQLFELRQLAESEYRRLKSSSGEDAAALVELQLTTAATARQILGAEHFEKFNTGHGRWLTDLSKL